MIIAIDFDGVIVTDCFPEIGTPLIDMPGVMNRLYNKGHILIINTCRSGKYAGEAKTALHEMNIPYHYFNENCPKRTAEYGQDCRKISADLYIDDKNLGGFPGWLAVHHMVGL